MFSLRLVAAVPAVVKTLQDSTVHMQARTLTLSNARKQLIFKSLPKEIVRRGVCKDCKHVCQHMYILKDMYALNRLRDSRDVGTHDRQSYSRHSTAQSWQSLGLSQPTCASISCYQYQRRKHHRWVSTAQCYHGTRLREPLA